MGGFGPMIAASMTRQGEQDVQHKRDRSEQVQDEQRQMQLGMLTRAREAAVANGASPALLDRLDQSIKALYPQPQEHHQSISGLLHHGQQAQPQPQAAPMQDATTAQTPATPENAAGPALPETVKGPDYGKMSAGDLLRAAVPTPEQESERQMKQDYAQRMEQSEAQQEAQRKSLDFAAQWMKSQGIPDEQIQDFQRRAMESKFGVKSAALRPISGAAGLPQKQPDGSYARPMYDSDKGANVLIPMPNGYQPPAPHETPDQRYLDIKAKEAQGQTLTPEEQAYLKATDALDKRKVAVAGARGASYNASKPVAVLDPNDPDKVTYMPAAQAEHAHAGTPASLSFQTRKGVVAAFTRGKQGDNVAAFNTLKGHLGLLSQAAQALQNGDVQASNRLAQRWGLETGQSAPTNFEAIREAVSGEVARTLSGKGATQQEINAARDLFNSAQSPQQLAGAIQEITATVEEKLGALKSQYQSGMEGQPAFPGEPAPKKKAGELMRDKTLKPKKDKELNYNPATGKVE